MSPQGPFKATVVTPPASGSRWVTVRFDGSQTPAPAQLATGATASTTVGARVYVDMIGKRPVIRTNI